MENFLSLALGTVAGRKPLMPVFCAFTGGLAQSLRACSACAGDYEDPDQTAWAADEEENDLALEKPQDRAQEKAENEAGVEGENDGANGDEFPAREA